MKSLTARERVDPVAAAVRGTPHRVEILEARIAPAAVLDLFPSENVDVSGDGASDLLTVFSVGGGTHVGFYNSGGLTSPDIDGVNVIFINATEIHVLHSAMDAGTLSMSGGGGTDQLTLNALLPVFNGLTADFENIDPVPGLIVGGGGLTLTATASDITITGNISKTTGGDATADLRSVGSIVISSGADITSSAGKLHVILNADRDASGSGGAYISAGGTAITTNGGDFTIGGGAAPASTPVFGPTEKAIYIEAATITTGAGNVSIRGQGDAVSGGGASIGIDITNGTSITTTSGNVTLVGTGGAVSDGFSMGVSLYNGSTISTGTGSIDITGSSSATGVSAYGVKIELNSKVEATGNGSITITGTGSASGSGTANDGVAMFNNADVTSAGSGAIAITATAGAGSTAFNSGSGSNDITIGGASATGSLTVSANTINFSNITLQGSGAATIQPTTAATTIGLGNSASGTLNLNDLEVGALVNGFSSITFGSASGTGAIDVRALTFNDAATIRNPGASAGGITVNGLITATEDLTLSTGGGITFNAGITLAANKNLTGTATGTISLANSSADLSATGTGAISLTTARDISLASGSSITTVNGALSLSANATGTNATMLDGIDIAAGTIQVTGSGNLTLVGKGGIGGGATANPAGIVVRNVGGVAGVVDGGTSGTVSVTGTGGNGTSAGDGVQNLVGVSIEGIGSKISSAGGSVQVTGIGGTSSGSASGGVLVVSGGSISAGGSGTVTVLGTGGSGTDFSYGVDVVHNGSMITSNNGSVTVTGTGGSGAGGTNWGVFAQLGGKITAGGTNTVAVTGTGGSGAGGNNHGVVVRFVSGAAGTITSGGGNVTVTGTPGTGGAGNVGLSVQSGGTISTATSGGNITLIADSMSIADVVSANSSSTVTIRQKTNSVAINLGSAVDTTASTLEISDAELDFVSAGTVQIGDSNSGAITVSAAISHLNTNAITLTAGTGQNINLNANFTTAGGPVTFSNAMVLGATASLDTTNAGGVPAGAAINVAGNIDLGANTLTWNSGATATSITTVISGASGGLTKLGTGTLTLTQANTYGGATTIGSGTLQLSGGADRLPTTTGVTIGSSASGGTFDLNGQNQSIASLTLGVTGGAGAFAGAVTTGAGTLTVNGNTSTANTSITNTHTISGNLNLGGAVRTVTVVNGASATDLNITATVTNGGISKAGAGTLALGSNSNTYAGGTTITLGTVSTGVVNGLGGGSVSISSGASLDLTTGTGTTTYVINGISGAGTINLTLGTGTNSLLIDPTTGNLSGFTGTINAGVGAAAGAGKYVINAADMVPAASATINVMTNATLYVPNVTVASGITLNGGDTGESLGQLRVENGGIVSGSVTLAGNITGTGDFTVGSNSGTGTISGNIGESGGSRALSKGGAATGTITLSGASNYTGLTTISSGILAITTPTALGTAAGATTVANNASLYISGGINVAEPITINGGGAPTNAGAIRSTAGNNTLSGLITIAAQARINADANTLTLDVASGSAVTATNLGLVTGGAGNIVISDPIVLGSGGLTQDGAGTTTVNGANIYTGSTIARSGTLVYGGSLPAGGAFIVGDTAATKAVLSIVPGAVITALNLAVGTNATATGAVYHSGGTLTLTQAAGIANFQLGAVASGYGYYSLSGGILNVNEVGIGAAVAGSTGVMDVTSGGTLNNAGWLTVGRGTTTSSGVLNVNGGTVNLTGAVAGSKIGMQYGTTAGSQSVINISGGGSITGPASTTYVLDLAASGNVAGTLSAVNIGSGGILSIGGILGSQVNPTTMVNINGGTLTPTIANAAFATDAEADTIFVYGSGATLNNNGVATTISRPISAPTGNGVVTPTVTTAGAGYIGAPMVTVSGGGGVGATAYATINPATGVVTGIVVTNPGTGYTSAPTFTLTGGGASTAATITGAANVANTSGALTVGGTSAGTVTLSGVNTFTGIANINAGTVTGGNNAAFGASAGKTVVASGATLNVGGNFNFGAEPFEVSGTGVGALGAIGNTGAAAQDAFQNVKLTGDATFGGANRFDIRGGIATLDLAGFTLTKIGASDVAIVSGTVTGGSINANAGRIWAEASTNVLAGTGTITVNNGGAFGAWNLTGTVSRPITINAGGALNDIGGTTSTIASPINLAGAGTITNTGTFNMSGIISGAGSLTKTGAGSTTLSSLNSYSGATTINAGTLSIAADTGLGTAPGAATPGHLTINGGTLATTASFTLAANRGLALGAPAASASGTINTATSTALIYNGIIADNPTGADSLVKAGAGSLTLGGVNTYTGTTTVSGGILSIGADSNLGIAPGAPASNLILSGGGTLATTGSFTLNANRSLSTGAGDGLISTAPATSLAYAGAITGTGSLSKIGTGTLTYTGTASLPNFLPRFGTTVVDTGGSVTSTSFTSIGVNSGDNAILTVKGSGQYLSSGDFNVSDLTGSTGVLNIQDSAVVRGLTLYVGKNGSASGTVNQSGGSFQKTAGAATDWRIGGPFNAVTDAASVGIYNLSGGTFDSGTANLQIGANATGTFTQTNGTATVGGFLAVGRFAGSNGTLSVSAGSFTANTQAFTIVGEAGTGTLTVSGTGTLNASALSIAHSAGGVGTVNLNGGTIAAAIVQKVGGSTASFNFNGGTLQATASSSTFMTGLDSAKVKAGGAIVDSNGNSIAIGQALLHDPALGATPDGGLVKNSAGVLTLSGANTFTGVTDLNTGTLALVATASNNNIAASPTIDLATGTTLDVTGLDNGPVTDTLTLASGQTLKGTGTVSGKLIAASGSTVAPGASPGIVATGDITFNSGSTLAIEIDGTTAGTGYDQTLATGSIDLGGATLSLTGTHTPVLGDSFTILTATGAVSNTFAGLANGSNVLFNSQPLSVTYNAGSVVLAFDSTPIIEGTAAADSFTISEDGSGNIVVMRGVTTVMTTPSASLTGLTINGNDGNDTFTVDYSGNGGFFSLPLTFNGNGQTGSPGDTLVLLDAPGTATTITHSFTSASDGSVNIDGTLLSYTGLEPITDNLDAVNRIFTFTGGAETITLTDSVGAFMTIDSTLGESVLFVNPTTSLTINAGSGDDAIDITSMDAAYAGSLTISGGGENDALTFGSGLPGLSALTTTSATLAALPALTIGAGGLSITTTGGAITQSGGLTVAGASAFTAGANAIALGASNALTGAVTLSNSGANNVSLVSTVALGVATTSVGSGTLALTGAGISQTGTITQAAAGGAVTLTAGTGAIALTLGNSFTGALTASSTGAGTGISINDISGGLAATSVTTTNGAITLSATGGALDVLLATAGTGGAINLTTTTSGNITLGNVTTSGTATLNSVGAIEENGADGTADLTATMASLTAATGIGAAGSIETALTNLSGTTATGGISLANAGVLAVTGLSATTSGNLALTNTGALSTTGAVSTASGTITVSAASPITIGANATASGDILFTAGEISDAGIWADDFTLTGGATIQSTAGAITLRAGDDIHLNAGTTVNASGAVILTAGFGDLDGSGSLNMQGTILSGAALSFTAPDDIYVNLINAPGQTITLTADSDNDGIGGIFDTNDAGIDVIADTLIISASLQFDAAGQGLPATTGIKLETQVSNLSATVGLAPGASSGSIVITNTGALNVTGLTTNSGDITISNTGTLTFSGDVSAGAGSLTVTAASPVIISANLTAAGAILVTAGETNDGPGFADDLTVNSGVSVTSTGSSVTLEAGDDIIISGGVASQIQGATTVTLTAANGDLDSHGGVTLNGSLVGPSGITVAARDAIALGASATTSAGAILITTAQGSITRSAGTLSAPSGTLTLTATNGGVGAAGVKVETASLSITATAGGAGGVFINENNAAMLSSITTAGGNVDISATLGALTIGTISAGTGDVTLTATGAGGGILDDGANGNTTIDITANDLSLASGTAGIGDNSVGALDVDVDTVAVATTTGANASVLINTVDSNNSGVLVTLVDIGGNGDITLTATSGSGTKTYTTVDNNDGNITIDAALGNIVLGTITSDSGVAGTSDISVTSVAGSITVNGVITSDDNVTLTAATTINDNAADNLADIVANTATLSAQTGIGTSSSFDLDVSTVTSAASATGGVAIDLLDANNSGVAVTSANASTSGNVTFTGTTGTGTRTFNTINAASGNITISANGGNIDIAGNQTASGAIAITSNATGDITRTGAGATLTAPTVTLTANGADGDIGTGANAILTTTATLSFTGGGTGDVFITESNGASVSGTTGSGAITLTTTTGDWTINGNISTTANVTMTASTGDILRTTGTVSGNALSFTAGGADGDIGASGAAIQTTGASVTFAGAGTGDVFNTESNGATVSGSTGSGAITLITTTGDWSIGGNISTTGNVTMTASAGDILRAAGTVSGNLLTLTAGGADGDIGQIGTPILTNATAVTFTGAGTGEVHIVDQDDVTLSGSTGSGPIRLESQNGDLLFGGLISTTGTVDLRAAAVSGVDGDIGTSGSPMLTSAGTISFAGAGTGDVFITEANGASVSGSTGSGNITLLTNTGDWSFGGNVTTTGNVTITATAGDLAPNPGFLIGGNLLTLTAGGADGDIGLPATPLLTAGTTIVFTGAGTGVVEIGELDGATISGTTGSGNVVVTSGGTLTIGGNISTTGNVTLNVAAGDILRTAGTVGGNVLTFIAAGADGDIGAGGAAIETTGTTISFTGAGTGDVFITESNGATVSGTTGSGTIDLTSTAGTWTIGGNITTTGNATLTASAGDILRTAGTVSGNVLTFTAGGADGDIGASGAAIQTTGTSITFAGTGTGDVFITESNGANVNGTTGSGTINLVSTTGNWTADGNISTTGNVTMTATTGDILRSAGTVSGNLVTLTAGGADGDIGASGAAIQTAATTIAFTGTGTGEVFITESNGASVSGTTGSGQIALTSTAGDWTVIGTGISTTGSVALAASAGDLIRSGAGAIVSGNTITLTAGGADGDIGSSGTRFLTTAAALVLAGAGTGDVYVTETNGANVQGSTGSGLIDLITTTGNWTINGNISTTGNVNVTASAGDILRTGAGSTVSGNTVTLTAGGAAGDIGSSALPILTVATAVAFTGTGTGNVFITESDDAAISGSTATGGITLVSTGGSLTLGLVSTSAAAGTVRIDASDAILDGNVGANNIVALGALLISGAGVGVVGDKLDTTITNLEADGGLGGVFVSDAGALNIGGVSAFNGVATTTDDIAITSGGALTITEDIVATAGDVTLTATAGTITETGGAIEGGVLTTVSVGGTLLNDAANQVDAFNATNTGSGNVAFINTASPLDIELISNATGGNVFVNNTGAVGVSGAITSGNPANGGDITIISSGLLTVDANVNSNAGAGGTLTLSSSVIVNASPTVGFGDIILQGGAGSMFINAPITIAVPLTLTATDNVIVNAAVTVTGLGNDLTVIADTDLDSEGGVLVTTPGRLNAGRDLTVRASDFVNASYGFGPFPGSSIMIESDGLNAQLLATRSVLVENSTAAGAAAINLGGRVESTNSNLSVGNMVFNGAVELIDDDASAIIAGVGSVSFTSTINSAGGNDLTVRTDLGNVNFLGVVGGVNAPGDIVIPQAGNVHLFAAFTADTFTVTNAALTVTYDGAVTIDGIGDAHSVHANSLVTNAPVTATAGNILWEVDNIELNDSVAGSETLTIRPIDATRSIGLNGAGPLNLDTAEIGQLQDGFAQITIGRTNGSGTVSTDGATFLDPTSILAPATGGIINVDGTLEGQGDGSFTLRAPTINLNVATPDAALQTEARLVHLIGNVKLLANTSIDTNFAAAGGTVTVDGTINGAFGLTIDAGFFAAGGAVNLNGGSNAPGGASVGGGTPLSSIDISGSSITLHPQIITNGAQSYHAIAEIITFGGALRSKVSGAITLDGPVTLNGRLPIITSGGAGADIVFTGPVNSEVGEAGALALNAGAAGEVSFGGDVGATVALATFEITKSADATFAGDLAVVGFIKIDATEIDFNGGANSVSGETITLQTDDPAQAVHVGGALDSGATVLDLTQADLDALADGFTSVTIARSSGTAGITIDAAGLDISDPFIFRQSTRTGTIEVNGPIDATGDGAVTMLSSTTTLHAGADITTAGGKIDIDYANLDSDIDFTTNGGDVFFRNTLQDTGAGGHALTLTVGAGDISFVGYVGTKTGPILGPIIANSTGITLVNKGLKAESFTTDAGGVTHLRGSEIRTTTDAGQIYGDDVLLLSNIRLRADLDGAISLAGTVNTSLGKIYSVSLFTGTGDITIGGNVGGGLGFGLLSTVRATAAGGDVIIGGDIVATTVNIRGANFSVNDVTTTSTQTYRGLATFNGAISSGTDLRVTTTDDIVGTAPWTVFGTTNLKTRSDADITLTNAGNNFGTLLLVADNATIVEASDTNLVSVKLAGDLDITSTGNITQTGRLTAFQLDAISGGTIAFTGGVQRLTFLGDISAQTGITILSGGQNLYLSGDITNVNGDVIISANHRTTNHNVINLSGANAIQITGAGRFLIYSHSAALTTLGGLAVDFSENGKRYPDAPLIANTGDGVIYVVV